MLYASRPKYLPHKPEMSSLITQAHNTDRPITRLFFILSAWRNESIGKTIQYGSHMSNAPIEICYVDILVRGVVAGV